ncbi:4-alpha-glucanotransferase [Breoghania sp.]|uniref:4-alpha-glucanotransferase n=1 Tax=Breoghania sp. TaxID=2065378 RepID=UPI002AA6BEC1|nr:4-alpha-glucanotransferase [Breoghania sp.]
MNVDNLNLLAGHFGIHPSYFDFDGNLIQTSVETQLAILRANGVQLDNDAMVEEAVQEYVIAERDRWFPRELIMGTGYGYECNFGLGARWSIELDERVTDEQRASVKPSSLKGIAETHISLPPLPAGIHDLICEVGGRTEIVTIISAPQYAPSLEALGGKSRIWGLNTGLYGLRSARNSGLGDYEDLARLSEFAQKLGGSFVGINPVHTLGFADPHAISPYSPSHRGFFNTQHIAVDRIPGLKNMPAASAILLAVETQWQELRASEQVDYLPHRICHNAALRDFYTLFLQQAEPEARQQFADFRHERGDYLQRFALYEALAEQYGQDWHEWPMAFQRREPNAIADATERFGARIDFYAWLQWVAGVQLADAQKRASGQGAGMGLYLDLAVGARHGGAESWCEAESVAHGVSLGAPPDQLGPDGQNWGLMTYAPRKLAANKYRSIRHIFRSAMRYAGILRIDHVLGLNRCFWIPEDGSPGAYVTQPLDTLLAILSIEANATQTAVIGEDLGLVPDGFREKVQSRGIYGYSVLQYEKWPDGTFKNPSDLRQYSLACFSTHDTPTLKGFMACTDINWREKLSNGKMQNAEEQRERRHADVAALAALNRAEGSDPDANFDTLFDEVHSALAQSQVAMIAVQMDDVLGQSEAQNLPGTIDEHPNWRRKCPLTLEGLAQEPAFARISKIMQDNDRNLNASEATAE